VGHAEGIIPLEGGTEAIAEEEAIENCKLQISNCKLEEGREPAPGHAASPFAARFGQFAIGNLQFAIFNCFSSFVLLLTLSPESQYHQEPRLGGAGAP
jgi:hypothetical protein